MPTAKFITPKIQDIANQISDWSKRNFGRQISKADGQVLGSLCPLMGIVEEFGEFNGCMFIVPSERKIEEQDAISDTMVYLADFVGREQDCKLIECEEHYLCTIEHFVGDLPWLDPKLHKMFQASQMEPFAKRMPLYIGWLAHVVLKKHQGIRGYDDPYKYKLERDLAVGAIIDALGNMAAKYDTSLGDMLAKVWAKVSKRDWTQNPNNADKVAENVDSSTASPEAGS